MKILSANVGSTSLKFKLFEMPGEEVICEAKAERIGNMEKAAYVFKNKKTGSGRDLKNIGIASFADGIRLFIDDLCGENGVISDMSEVKGVGFKAVLAMGYYGVHLVDEGLLAGLAKADFLSPTHTKPYLNAIEQFREVLPNTPMVCSFETAFHETIPYARRVYPISYDWTKEYDILRRGYHGATHSYIAYAMEKRCNGAGRVISCHFGGSSSMCAIKDGLSQDITFGWSLQNGLVHGKRIGDIDPYIIPYLLKQGLTEEDVFDQLNNNAGLKGISGISDDMRDIEEAAAAGNERAQLALDVFVEYALRNFGAFYAELGGLDHLVFTGGIGEHSAYIRKAIVDKLGVFGLKLDEQKNAETMGEGIISTPDSAAEILVLPTNEELMIARATYMKVQ